MLQLQVETRPIQLQYDSSPAQLQQSSRRAQLAITTQAAELAITSPPGRLIIDHTPWRYSLGLKTNTDFGRDYTASCRQALLEGIIRRVETGRQLGAVERSENPIADVAAAALYRPLAQLTLTPLAAPDISYQVSNVNYQTTPGRLNYHYTPAVLNSQVQPAKLSIRTLQYPMIRMWTIGSTVDLNL